MSSQGGVGTVDVDVDEILASTQVLRDVTDGFPDVELIPHGPFGLQCGGVNKAAYLIQKSFRTLRDRNGRTVAGMANELDRIIYDGMQADAQRVGIPAVCPGLG